jgi:hypothetical protein
MHRVSGGKCWGALERFRHKKEWMNSTETEMRAGATPVAKHAESWERATLKGTLFWGSIYSTATVGSACLLIPALTDQVIAFSEVMKSALVVCPFAGALRGALMWRMLNGYHVFRLGCRRRG